MKFLQFIVVMFAIVGCLALALGGFYVYTVTRHGGFNISFSPAKKAPAQTTAPLTSSNTAYASLLKDYQPTPTPAPAVPGAPAASTVAAASIPVTPTPRPIHTPGPDTELIRDWPSGRKWVCLTFDDGPHPTYTRKFIDVLKSKNVKATFFLIGPNVKKWPEIAREIHENGFEIGNHTMTHPDFKLRKYTPEKIFEELDETSKLIKEYSGQKEVTLMRPPYGYAPKKVRDQCTKLGLNIITWNIDTNDWSSKTTADEMTSNIMTHLRDGSIILMHDRSEKSLETTERVIDMIRDKGFEFVTVSELLGLKPLQPGPADIARARQAALAQKAAQQGSIPTATAPLSNVAPPVPSAPAPQQAPTLTPVPPAASPAAPSVEMSLPAPQASPAGKIAPGKVTTLPALKDKY